jgi:hypothetical protein
MERVVIGYLSERSTDGDVPMSVAFHRGRNEQRNALRRRRARATSNSNF